LSSSTPRARKMAAMPQKPGRAAISTPLTARAASRHTTRIRFRGTVRCRSAQLPIRGWAKIPARHRMATKTPASALEKPRFSTRAVWYPAKAANMAQ
jgi:hypothetical protein